MKARNPNTGIEKTIYVKALDTMPVGAEIDFDGDITDIPAGWEAVGNNYSTDEIKTGQTWIDGKPIYRKVISTGAISGTNPVNFALPSDVDTLLPNLCGMLYDSGGNGYPINYNNIYNVQQDIGSLYFVQTSTNKRITIKQYANFGITSGYIIVEYTKTTD